MRPSTGSSAQFISWSVASWKHRSWSLGEGTLQAPRISGGWQESGLPGPHRAAHLLFGLGVSLVQELLVGEPSPTLHPTRAGLVDNQDSHPTSTSLLADRRWSYV